MHPAQPTAEAVATPPVRRKGRAGRNPDGFAATLQRLLNVEGYPVLGLADGGRTLRLDQELLRQQFGLDLS